MKINEFPFELFNIITSTNVNKELYLKILLMIYEEYKTLYESLDKSTCVSMILNNLREEIMLYQTDENDKITTLFETLEQGKAKILLNNLVKYKWLEEIDDTETLDIKIILPKHTLEIISGIENIINPKEEETDVYIYSIYNNLKSIVSKEYNEDKDDISNSRYFSLITAWDLSKKFNQHLNTIISEIKNYYQNLLEITDVKDLMKEHFEIYAQNFTNTAYHNLKTKDNLYKYKSKILELLNEISFNEEITKDIVTIVKKKKKIELDEDGFDFVYNTIETIRYIFENLEKNIACIDKKHKEYVTTATSRIEYIQYRSKDICNDIFKLIEAIKEDETIIDLVSNKLNILSVKTIEENSIYTKSSSEKKEFKVEGIDIAKNSNNKLIEPIKQKYNKKEVEEFINNLLVKDVVNVKELNVSSDEEYYNLIMSCFYSSKGNPNFKIEFLGDDNVENNNYILPNFNIVKKV